MSGFSNLDERFIRVSRGFKSRRITLCKKKKILCLMVLIHLVLIGYSKEREEEEEGGGESEIFINFLYAIVFVVVSVWCNEERII